MSITGDFSVFKLRNDNWFYKIISVSVVTCAEHVLQ